MSAPRFPLAASIFGSKRWCEISSKVAPAPGTSCPQASSGAERNEEGFAACEVARQEIHKDL